MIISPPQTLPIISIEIEIKQILYCIVSDGEHSSWHSSHGPFRGRGSKPPLLMFPYKIESGPMGWERKREERKKSKHYPRLQVIGALCNLSYNLMGYPHKHMGLPTLTRCPYLIPSPRGPRDAKTVAFLRLAGRSVTAHPRRGRLHTQAPPQTEQESDST